MHKDVHCCPVYSKEWLNKLECLMDCYPELAILKIKSTALWTAKSVQDFLHEPQKSLASCAVREVPVRLLTQTRAASSGVLRAIFP